MRDELEELMQEPPGGHNHGRKCEGGRWHSLNAVEAGIALDEEVFVIEEPRSQTRRKPPNKPWDTIRHGTASAYQNDCRHHPSGPCDACREAWAGYVRSRRKKKRV